MNINDGFDFDLNNVKLPDWPQAVFALAKALEHYAAWLDDFAYGDPADPHPTPPSPDVLAAIKRVAALQADLAEEVKLQDGHELLNVQVAGNA